jgi:hypothetical protein
MSRSIEIQENPATKFIQWKNKKEEKVKEGTKTVLKTVRETGWYYYDKASEENIQLQFPITFIWLESMAGVTGYDEKKETGIWSNEVRNSKKDKFVVKAGNETIAEGNWDTVKEETAGLAKFANIVYGLVHNNDGDFEVCRFKMAGSALSSWINFQNNAKNRSHSIVCTGFEEVSMKTGGTYDAPTFKYVEAPSHLLEEADKVCKEQIDPFFEYYLSEKPVDEKLPF